MSFNILPPEDFVTAVEVSELAPPSPVTLDSSQNIKAGDFALSSITASATNNIAFGYQALHRNRFAYSNIANGNNSLANIVFGGSNIALGDYSLYSANDADDNIAIGYSAGYGITGSRNVSIGRSSLSYATGTYYSVAVGAYSLHNSWGSRNTAIGMYSGYYISGGYGNVFIGYSSGMFADGQNNKLYISNDSRNNPLIYGEFDNNYLKINGKLEVENQPLSERVARNITISTSDPSGGISGDIWLKYTA